MNLREKLLAGAVFLGLAGLLGTCVNADHLDRESFTGKVTGKEVKRKDDTDKYLIFVELQNGETRVFENTDSWLEWKHNSSDVYGEIEEGKTYRFDTYGFRLGFMSWYENIVGFEEVKTK